MHLVEQHPTHNLANAGDGLQPVERLRIRLLGCLDDRQLAIVQQPIVGVNEGQVDVDTLLHGGIRAPFRHAIPIRLVGEFLPDLGEVVLAVGMLDVGEKLGAFARQMQAPPEEVPGGTHRGGIDRRLGEHPAP
jgi:hypothetical protein